MASDNGSAAPSTGGKKYTRFPRSTINTVLDFPKAIIKEGYDLKKDRLCGMLNRSANSGHTDAAIAAARAYDLIQNGSDGYIAVSELGRRACSEDPQTRVNAFAEALSKVDEFRRFLDKYSESKVPSQGVAEDYLTSSMGLKSSEAGVFYKTVLANARDAGLTEMLPGGEFFRSAPVAPAVDPDGEQTSELPEVPIAINVAPLGETPQPARQAAKSVEMHFNIQVHLPESTDPEVYDAIFRSMKANLLGD